MMQGRLLICAKIIGLMLMIFSLNLVPVACISFVTHDGAFIALLHAFEVTFATGLLLWLPARACKKSLRTRDGFLIVVLFYITLSLFGALPFLFVDKPNISFTNAYFESASGVTTTGSSVLNNIDSWPKSLIYYRQQLQFLGGMGIIVLAVAVLPMLGVGGMALYRAETTGLNKERKLTPRITETAKALWLIYISLTLSCFLAYLLVGLPAFDALAYAYSTVATGGYAPHQASVGYYPNNPVQVVCIVFMLLGSLNFSLHFHAITRLSLSPYWRDIELKVFFGLLLLAVLLIYLLLRIEHVFDSQWDTLINSAFHVTSIMTTTGFAATEYANWPSFAPYLILIMGLVGGCSGSTAGGIKVVRLLILLKQSGKEIKRLIHPSGQFIAKLNHKTVPSNVIDSVVGFIALYTLLFMMIVIALLALHLDFTTAFSSTVACLANVGPGLAATAFHFDDINQIAKWILIAAMFLGRLELFTVIVLFSPVFWRS